MTLGVVRLHKKREYKDNAVDVYALVSIPTETLSFTFPDKPNRKLMKRRRDASEELCYQCQKPI